MALDPFDPFGLLALTARLDALERDLAALRAQQTPQPTPAPTPAPTPGPSVESAHGTKVTDRVGQITDRTLNVYKLAA